MGQWLLECKAGALAKAGQKSCLVMDGNTRFGFIGRRGKKSSLILIPLFYLSPDNIFECTDWQTLFKNVQSGWKVCFPSIILLFSSNLTKEKCYGVMANKYVPHQEADHSHLLNWWVKKHRPHASTAKTADLPWVMSRNIPLLKLSRGWPRDLVNPGRMSLKAT